MLPTLPRLRTRLAEWEADGRRAYRLAEIDAELAEG
jgi:hypothetical protein